MPVQKTSFALCVKGKVVRKKLLQRSVPLAEAKVRHYFGCVNFKYMSLIILNRTKGDLGTDWTRSGHSVYDEMRHL